MPRRCCPAASALLTGAPAQRASRRLVALTAPYSSAELYSPGSNRLRWRQPGPRDGHTPRRCNPTERSWLSAATAARIWRQRTYDVASNRWSSGPMLATARSGHAALVVPNRAFPDFVGNPVVVVAGGNNSNGTRRGLADSTCGSVPVVGRWAAGLGDGVTLAAGLHQFAAINLASGLRLTAAGSRVLDLRSLGAATVAGVIDVSGADGAAGIDQGVTNNDTQGANGGGGGPAIPTPWEPRLRCRNCPATAGGGSGSAGASRQACAPGGGFGGGAGGAAADGNRECGGGGGGGYGGGAAAACRLSPTSPSRSRLRQQGRRCVGSDPVVTAGGKPGKAPRDRRASHSPAMAPLGKPGQRSSRRHRRRWRHDRQAAAADLAIITTFQPGSGGGGGAGAARSVTQRRPRGRRRRWRRRRCPAHRVGKQADDKWRSESQRRPGRTGRRRLCSQRRRRLGGAIALVGKSLSLIGKLSATGGVGGAAAEMAWPEVKAASDASRLWPMASAAAAPAHSPAP